MKKREKKKKKKKKETNDGYPKVHWGYTVT
jgi:hypothetical protein